ncbi:MAG: DUF1810 family protein [Acidobacteria bacterium]|nr:DUF1810 family protein [Acidobacteriota bacterium]
MDDVAVDLDRFILAQNDPIGGFVTALAELRADGKRSHWIWYIFPQLAGLGSSPMAERYGLRGVLEAIAYLEEPLLRERLLAATIAAADQVRRGMSLHALMGSDVDVRKLISSMTLFGELTRGPARARSELATLDAAQALHENAEVILRAAAEEGLSRCAFTLDRLGKAGSV